MAVVVVATANEAMGDSAVVDGLVPVVVVDTVVLEVEISPRTVVSGAEKIAIHYDNCRCCSFNQLLPMFYQLIPHNYPTPTMSQLNINIFPTSYQLFSGNWKVGNNQAASLAILVIQSYHSCRCRHSQKCNLMQSYHCC